MNMRFLYHALYRIVWPFFSLAHPVRAQGRENIPEGGAVLCANHSRPVRPHPGVLCLHAAVDGPAHGQDRAVPGTGPWAGLLGKSGVILCGPGPRGCARGEGGPQVAEGGPEAADIPGGHPGP